MLDSTLHKTKLINILKSIYTDPITRNNLGFKGGTAAMLFYELPRFSVDLDFDLLNNYDSQDMFNKVSQILKVFGDINDSQIKRNTIFFLLNYAHGQRNLKIEISTRITDSKFKPINYLGISMLVMDKGDMVTNKLVASLTRKKFASRDLFDLWFFLTNGWQLNPELFSQITKTDLSTGIDMLIEKIDSLKSVDLISGMGDLLDQEQRDWARSSLLKELTFQLKLYQDVHLKNP